MRRLSALVCLILIAWTAPAAAQTAIHRCIGANGNPLFTDQPCSALQATPIKPVAGPAAGTMTTPLPVLCAASLAALKQSVIEAFANHDANRMAGLMLWNGYGHGAAVADIRSLSTAMQQSLLDLGTPDDPASAEADSMPSADTPDASWNRPVIPTTSSPSDQLILHTSGGAGSGNPHELRFTIVRRSGCLWLRNAG